MVSYVLVGAGARGKDAYGRWIATHPSKARLVAVAEPRAARREQCAAQNGIPRDACFADWRELFSRPKMADACIVATQDNDHLAPATAAMAAGYHVLLEKPMAPNEADCRAIAVAAEKHGVVLRICHVLRTTRFFSSIHDAIAGGMLGELVTIRHSENVGYWHYAHSYVRGNWRTTATASPLILAKSCHDLDALCWLAGSQPIAVQSFGSLEHFRADKAPEGAPLRCTDGCPHAVTCPWYAPRMYLGGTPMLKDMAIGNRGAIGLVARVFATEPLDRLWDWKEWPVATISDDLSREARMEALRTGPYGRCVYHCDNDVVDHQVVNVEFGGGVTASFSVHGHSYLEGRQIRVDGTAGSLEGWFGQAGQELFFYDHRRGGRRRLWRSYNPFKGHGGGDDGLMEQFTRQIEAALHGKPLTDDSGSAAASLRSHLLCFAAERSRLSGAVVRMDDTP